MPAASTILLFVSSGSPTVELPCEDAGGILPGHILLRTSTGGLIRNNLTVSYQDAYVAVEDTAAGKEVDDAYPLGDTVRARRLRTGDICLLRMTATGSIEEGTPVAVTDLGLGEIINSGFTEGFGMCVDHTAGTPITGPALIKVEIKYL